MKQRRPPTRLVYPFLAALAFVGLSVAGCEQAPLQPHSSGEVAGSGIVSQMAGAGWETVPLTPVKPRVEGTSALQRRSDGFTFRISARGLTPRHPVTLWVMDLQTGDVGRGAGGIVSGAGTVNLAGNNCVDEGGKMPGTPPVCDLIDPEGDIRFILLEGEDEWTPGDQSVRWTPSGKPAAARADHLVDP